MDIAVLCPSRDNPGMLAEAAAAFFATRKQRGSRFIAVVDYDEPQMEAYLGVAEDAEVLLEVVPRGRAGSMNAALNHAAMIASQRVPAVGFIGDDHRFRTPGWDTAIGEALGRSGIVYGNDLYQGEWLPTQVFIRSTVIKALGWMGLPGCRHLYLDDTWKTLGNAAGCLEYLPDVHIEHMHPAAGKAVWDANHQRVNTPEMYSHDREVFGAWLEGKIQTDIALVKEAMKR